MGRKIPSGEKRLRWRRCGGACLVEVGGLAWGQLKQLVVEGVEGMGRLAW